jgi:hypothetical protein
VAFHPDRELECIEFKPGERKIASVIFTDEVVHAIDRLLWLLKMIWPAAIPDDVVETETTPPQMDADRAPRCAYGHRDGPLHAGASASTVTQFHADCQSALTLANWILAQLERPPEPLQTLIEGIGALDAAMAPAHRLSLAEDEQTLLEKFRTGNVYLRTLRKKRGPKRVTVDGDYFLFALPVEQMAYYVNRSATMTHHDPTLKRVVKLAEYTDWMAGIQFFLREPFDAVKGHVCCMDSEWGLTAIEETQFWRDIDDFPSDVKSVISVDIAAWDAKGRFCHREAFNCTDDEIAHEVWSTLKASLNRDTKSQWLRDDMLRGQFESEGARCLKRNVNYYLDASIVDLYDRRKQASYEKARSVRFSTVELVKRQHDTGEETQTPLIWGDRLRYNVEPLLINRAGAQALRPDARTGIPNMFLASDYVRTNTDLACMEGANEAARRAVNAILEAAGSTAEPCRIWSFSTPEEVVERMATLAQLGEAPAAVSGLFRTAGALAGGLLGQAGAVASTFMARGRKAR